MHKGFPLIFVIFWVFTVFNRAFSVLGVSRFSEYGVFSGSHFPAFGVNTERYELYVIIVGQYIKGKYASSSYGFVRFSKVYI